MISRMQMIFRNFLRSSKGNRSATFASRWKGKFQPSGREDQRYGALAKKYLD